MTFYAVYFYTLSFLNLGDSIVLDYKQECKTICAKLGIKRENCTSQEDALIDEVYKSHQELENERERTNNEKERANRLELNVAIINKKLGKLEEQKETAESLARQLACPTRIRYWIENYDLHYLNDPGSYVRKVNNIEGMVQKNFNRTLLGIENAVKRLNATFTKPKPTKEFEDAWIMLKENLPNKQEKIRMRYLSAGTTSSETIKGPNSLEIALEELCEAENVTVAQELWAKQCSSDENKWNALPGEFTLMDNVILRSLAFEKIIFLPDQDTNDCFETEYDRNFARDFILSEKHYGEVFTIRNQNKYYRKCRRTIYYSNDEEINDLRQILKKVQSDKHKPFYMGTERYCEIVGRLWHLVSEVSEHTAGVQVIGQNCLPQSKDYELYVQNLRNMRKDDFVWVINIMSTCRNIFPTKDQKEE